MATRTEANGLRRKRRRAAAAAVAGGVILITWMSWLTVRHTTDVSAKDNAQSAKTSAVASASAVGSVANQGKALASNVTDECQSAVFRRANPALCVQASVLVTATPVVIPGPQGPQGPGPSQQQIEQAVASYCALITCVTGPTAPQVAQAVATYCNVHGQCAGPPGSPGTSGSAGPTGSTGLPGNPGQNATADQIADAVTTYCAAHNNCIGKDGEAGPTGSAGPPGSSGQPGQPPVSWKYTDALNIEHTCNRTDPFDPASPTYTCT